MAGFLLLIAASPNAPLAPILAQTSVVSNTKPEFLAYGQFAVNDVLQFERQVDGGDWSSPTTTTHTVTSGELGGTAISLGLATLTAGSYQYRAKYKHVGGAFGPYSPIENGVVDLTLNFQYQAQTFWSGTSGGTVKTATGIAAGTAFANRRVFVFGVVTDDGASNIASGFKINNVSATLFASAPAPGSGMYYVATALVPTGTTVDLELTMSSGSFFMGPAYVYTCDDGLLTSPTPNATQHLRATATSSSLSIATLSGGVTICLGTVFTNTTSNPSITSSSDTFTTDLSNSTAYFAAHSLNNQARTANIVAGWSPSSDNAFVAWSFR